MTERDGETVRSREGQGRHGRQREAERDRENGSEILNTTLNFHKNKHTQM